MFREALAAGTLESYFGLAEQFHTQADPAFCGLGSLVMALNALSIDPGRAWKGPWRWFAEELLDCCVPLDQVRTRGLTLHELSCLASCNGARSTLRRASDLEIAEFRGALERSCRAPGEPVVVAGYSRAALGQTGAGHFSPLAGYHAERDLVLVLDVARFKYPPHWVPVTRLFDAMRTIDPESGQSRGYLELVRSVTPRQLTFVFQHDRGGWQSCAQLLCRRVPERLGRLAAASTHDVLRAVLEEARDVLEGVQLRRSDATGPLDEVAAIVRELESTAIYREVCAVADGGDTALATLFVLLVPEEVWQLLPAPLARSIAALTDPSHLPANVARDVTALRTQVAELFRGSSAACPSGPMTVAIASCQARQ